MFMLRVIIASVLMLLIAGYSLADVPAGHSPKSPSDNSNWMIAGGLVIAAVIAAIAIWMRGRTPSET